MLNHPEICWVHDPALTERSIVDFIAQIRCSTEWEAFRSRIRLSIFEPPSHPLETPPEPESSPESGPETRPASPLAKIPFWLVDPPQCDYQEVIYEVIRVISQSAFPTWDTIGRLTCVIAFKPSYRGRMDIWNMVVQCARNTLDTVQSRLYRYFLLDGEDNDYPSD